MGICIDVSVETQRYFYSPPMAVRMFPCSRLFSHLPPTTSASVLQVSFLSFCQMPVALNPDFGIDDIKFPKLPEIRSFAVRSQVFTHRSYYARPTHVFEDHPLDPSLDNEKYEHLGDTVLGMAVTHLLMKRFPYIHVGPSTVHML